MMATCKDCVHDNICNIKQRYNHPKYALQHIEKYCEHFKDRSRFVELPCKVGNKLYLSTEARDKIMRLLVLMSCDPELLEVESEEYIKQLIKEYGNNGKC